MNIVKNDGETELIFKHDGPKAIFIWSNSSSILGGGRKVFPNDWNGIEPLIVFFKWADPGLFLFIFVLFTFQFE